MVNKDIQYGIKESKEVIDFAIGMGVGVSASLQDGKINFLDLPNFMPALLKAIPALEGIDLVSLEFMDLKPEEAEELKIYVKEQLKLEDDKLEEFIEDAFAVVLSIFMLAKTYFIKQAPKDAVDVQNNVPESNS